jgi:hypothetical protein
MATKKRIGITKEEFLSTRITLPERARFLGCWENKDVLYGVYAYPNGAKLRMTYYKPAGMVLACAKDYYGNYHCISSNVKTMEELVSIIENFDWKMYDAKKAKQWTGGVVKHTSEQQEDKQEIAELLERIHKL